MRHELQRPDGSYEIQETTGHAVVRYGVPALVAIAVGALAYIGGAVNTSSVGGNPNRRGGHKPGQTYSQPGQPALQVVPGDTFADLSTNDFSGSPGDSHASSDWWITKTNDATDTVWSSFTDVDSLTSWKGAGASTPLQTDTSYIAHARHNGTYGGASPEAVDTFTATSGVVILSGSGFGTKTTAAPLLYQDYDSLAVGADAAAAGFDLGVTGSSNDVVDSLSHSGSQSIHRQYYTNQYPKTGLTIPRGTVVYHAYWFYWTRSGTATQSPVFKLQRQGCNTLYTGTPHSYTTSRISASTDSINSDQLGVLTDSGYTYIDNSVNNPPQQGAWHFMETWYKLSDPGVANGRVTTKVDGITEGNLTNAITRTATEAADSIDWVVQGFDGIDQKGDALTYDLYIDDSYIDTTWARVVLTDDTVYASSTDWMPQKPSSWSATQIVIDHPRWGTFTTGARVFFHIFDATDTEVGIVPYTVP